MKILHSSDWHLGARTGGIDRADDAFARLDELGRAIDAEQVDLLLVAGDIFDEHRSERLPVLLRRLGASLTPRVAEGMRAIFVAGNHDREQVFPLLRNASALFGPTAEQHVIFTEHPILLQVPSRDGSEAVQVACVPYPTHHRYDLPAQSWPSVEAKRRELADAVRARIDELAIEAATRTPGLPVVLAGHLLVRGVRVGAYCLSEAEDIPVERGDLPDFAYVALGHIHKGQAVGAEHVRYCGSIERMDRGEEADEKGAVLVTVPPTGPVAWRTVPLDATPFRRIEATSEADLLAAHAALAEPERTMVSLALNVDEQTSVNTLLTAARRFFPRLYGNVDIRRPAAPQPAGVLAGVDHHDVARTVRTYLQTRLAGDPDLEALTALADELLAQEPDDSPDVPATRRQGGAA